MFVALPFMFTLMSLPATPRALPSTYTNTLNAVCEIYAGRIPNCFVTNMDFFIFPDFWLVGMLNISFQRAATGKCATSPTHLICHFDYLAATYEPLTSVESKTIVH